MVTLAGRNHAVHGDRPGCSPGGRRRTGYTLLELHVALVILAVGLLSLPALMAVQSRQIRRVEAWCRSEPEFYVISQSNRWLRRLGAPAELADEAGATVWTPPVDGPQQYEVELKSVQQDVADRAFEAEVTLRPAE